MTLPASLLRRPDNLQVARTPMPGQLIRTLASRVREGVCGGVRGILAGIRVASQAQPSGGRRVRWPMRHRRGGSLAHQAQQLTRAVATFRLADAGRSPVRAGA